MGSQCFATTPNEHYRSFFQSVKVSELKDNWPTLNLQRLKKMYNFASSPHPSYSNHTHLTYEKFKFILPEIAHYQETHKRRIFQIFDYDNQGFVDWNNFYKSISICYFGSDYILSVLLFMIFDDHLVKELDQHQLIQLLSSNQKYKHQNIQLDNVQICQNLMGTAKTLSIRNWIDNANQIIDISKFRTIFNIFLEEKMEKQLVQNYNQWNNLYNQQEDRYITYVISFKWFESWKVYVLQKYGISLSNNITKINTAKSIKSKKNIYSKIRKTNLKVSEAHHLKLMSLSTKIKGSNYGLSVKNFDYIHSNLGQRPMEIYNSVIEGEYEDVLKQQIIENRDYTLVSERVWEYLSLIYNGFPQFRRTGYNLIELYPKILKIYSSLFRDQIDYSSQVTRQVSGYVTVKQLIIRSLQIQEQSFPKKVFFYKTIGMSKWVELKDLSIFFSELSSEIIIFLIYLNEEDAQILRNNSKNPKTLNRINVGDEIKFMNSQSMDVYKNAIFMGKNVEGKYILHFIGQSYIFDICVSEEEFYEKAQIYKKNKDSSKEVITRNITNQYIGIPALKGTAFINSCILHLLRNQCIKKTISNIIYDGQGPTNITQCLRQINKLMQEKKQINGEGFITMIDSMMPDFKNFQMSMCEGFLQSFFQIIQSQLKESQQNSIISDQFKIQVEKTVQCRNCQIQGNYSTDERFISLQIPQTSENYYEIMFVPFCKTFKATDIKRYGFKLPANSLLKDYKAQFQRISEVNTHYILLEVSNNTIIKNYSNSPDSIPLNNLFLRETDEIYAYQIYTDFSKFIHDHYTPYKNIQEKRFKIGDFVDCNNDDRGWIFGKVLQIDPLTYTSHQSLRVGHSFSKNERWQINYDLCKQNVASFPTKSYLNGEQYHVRMLQRYFNQPTNEMKVCGLPLIMVLANWMRWKQFYYIVYLQMKRFIVDGCQFHDDKENQDYQLYSNKSLDKKQNRKSKAKLNKFKEYLCSDSFPYRLNLVDIEGRCVICLKFLKTTLLKGETQLYCQGCELNQYQPISLQIKVVDIMVCIDWKSIHYTKSNIIKDHSTYANLLMEKKNNHDTLQNCIKHKMKPYYQQNNSICCNTISMSQIKQKIINKALNLIFFLQRIVQQDDFNKTTMRHISFNTELIVNENRYYLIGVTSVQGSNLNIGYKSYILSNDDEWLEYDGRIVKIVKKNVVLKSCAIVLYYRLEQAKKFQQNNNNKSQQIQEDILNEQSPGEVRENTLIEKKKQQLKDQDQRIQQSNIKNKDQNIQYLIEQQEDVVFLQPSLNNIIENSLNQTQEKPANIQNKPNNINSSQQSPSNKSMQLLL